MLSYIYKHAPNPPSRLSFFRFLFFCPLPTPLRLCWTAKRRRHETSDLCTRNEHGPSPFCRDRRHVRLFHLLFPFYGRFVFPFFHCTNRRKGKKKKTEREQERTKKERKKKRGGNLLSETHHATRIRLFSRPRVLRYYQQECASRLERLLSGRHRPWAKLVTDADWKREWDERKREICGRCRVDELDLAAHETNRQTTERCAFRTRPYLLADLFPCNSLRGVHPHIFLARIAPHDPIYLDLSINGV